MKNIKLLFTTLLFIGLAFNSCDVIEEPFTFVVQGCDICEDFEFDTPNNTIKKVLLEEYTGHKCGNCPRAAEKAQELKNSYGDQLIVLSVHAGFFASTFTGNYEADYTTEAGNDWDSNFGNSAAGNPNGMVNRIGFTQSTHILQDSQWGQKIDDELAKDPEYGLQVKASYDDEQGIICINTYSEKYPNANTDNVNINVVLSESHIISYQTDYDAEPSDIPDYEHNHVLRASITSSWGLPISFDENVSHSSYCIEKESDWNKDNLSVIAFISDAETFEVLQAEEVYIIE